jgi:nitroreductase
MQIFFHVLSTPLHPSIFSFKIGTDKKGRTNHMKDDPIFLRTSVREFTAEKVEEDKIERLLKAAMQAPSAMNQQPWEFYAVTDPETLKKLGKATPFSSPAGRAPLAIVPMMKKDGIRLEQYREIDLSFACENILLEAEELSLGGVVMGIAPFRTRMEDVRRILNAPENLEVFAIIAIGYPLREQKQVSRYDPKRVHRI